jgi:hypothetical protein
MRHLCKQQTIVGGVLVALALFLAGFGCGYGNPGSRLFRCLPHAPADYL